MSYSCITAKVSRRSGTGLTRPGGGVTDSFQRCPPLRRFPPKTPTPPAHNLTSAAASFIFILKISVPSRESTPPCIRLPCFRRRKAAFQPLFVMPGGILPATERMARTMNDQEFLNRSDDWLKYAIRLNLRNEPESSIADLKSAALKDDRIQSCLADVARLHDRQITNHKDPLLPIHRLLFLLDLGFGMDIPQIKAAVQEILKHRDERGVYQSLINVPQHFGGSGEGRFCWWPLRCAFASACSAEGRRGL